MHPEIAPRSRCYLYTPSCYSSACQLISDFCILPTLIRDTYLLELAAARGRASLQTVEKRWLMILVEELVGMVMQTRLAWNNFIPGMYLFVSMMEDRNTVLNVSAGSQTEPITVAPSVAVC
jgi:hypothetical protein